MVCACAELVVCLAAFASDEPKKASDEPKKKKRRSRRVRQRYDEKMRKKRAEEAALRLFPVLELEPFHVDLTDLELSD